MRQYKTKRRYITKTKIPLRNDPIITIDKMETYIKKK